MAAFLFAFMTEEISQKEQKNTDTVRDEGQHARMQEPAACYIQIADSDKNENPKASGKR